MKNQKSGKQSQSLQKLTELEIKIQKLLELEIIKPDDIKSFSQDELNELSKVLMNRMEQVTGIDRDRLVYKMSQIISQETKSEMWEYNHHAITAAISNMMQEFGRMPSKTEIATSTKLSRQTVHKHLKDYASNPIYLGQIEQFRFMASKVLTKVFHYAVNGDMGAAKLYFNVMGAFNGQLLGQTNIETQNNYVQINNTIINQDAVRRLTSEQLNQIEGILKEVAMPMEKKISI
jgi:hypothetical protein